PAADRARHAALRALERGHQRARAAGAARHAVVPPVRPAHLARGVDGLPRARERRARVVSRRRRRGAGLGRSRLSGHGAAAPGDARPLPRRVAVGGRAAADRAVERRSRSRRRVERLLPAWRLLPEQPARLAALDRDHRLRRVRPHARPPARRLRAGAVGAPVAGGSLPAVGARVHPPVRHRGARRRRRAARDDAGAADASSAVARQPGTRARAARAAAPRAAALDRRTGREPRTFPGRTRVTRPVPLTLELLDRVFPPNPSAFMSSAEQTVHESVKATETMGSYLAELGDTGALDILDYGCGWGGETLWVARRVRSACGVDVDAKAIKQARNALATSGARNCRFELSADGRLPFPDASFDAALSTDTFEHVMDLPLAFKEIARVLRPGGSLLTRFGPLFRSPHGGHLYWACQVPYAHLLFGMDAIVALRERRGGKPRKVGTWQDLGLNGKRLEDYRAAMAAAGFDVVPLRPTPARWPGPASTSSASAPSRCAARHSPSPCGCPAICSSSASTATCGAPKSC